ncbi:hypothetical protein GC176_10805 [bacterium]|nr:hypothetical protein [bacterium]
MNTPANAEKQLPSTTGGRSRHAETVEQSDGWPSKGSWRHAITRTVVAMAALLLICGCRAASLTPHRNAVSEEIVERFGADLGNEIQPGESLLPPHVSTDDGLTEEEAIATALWNNAAFQELLAQLGVSNAQLFNAGLVGDPQLLLYFPVGPKIIETFGYQTLDAFWLRKIRMRAAKLDLDRVSQTMVQNGLNVIRDVRRAYAELIRASETEVVSREAARLRVEIAALAQKRLAAGDISELEATTSQIDALNAQATAERAAHDVTLAREQLRTLMGIGQYEDTLTPDATSVDVVNVSISAELEADLVNAALASRPDLCAAETAIDSASELLNLSHKQFMNVDGVYNGKPVGQFGFLTAPGLRFTVPIFNGNRGNMAIAEAQLQQAARRYVTIRDQVTLEVRTAQTQLLQAQENLQTLRERILPVLREAESLARSNYENGGAPYFLVLQTTGQYLDARTRELQLVADVRNAAAELDRGVGRRVTTETTSTAAAIEIPAVPGVADDDPISARPVLPPAPVVSLVSTVADSPKRKDRETEQPQRLDTSAIRVPLQVTRDAAGRISAAIDDSAAADRKDSSTRSNRPRKRNRSGRKAERSEWKRTNQEAEHVQVTIDIRLDPRLVPSGVRTAASGPSSEDSPGEDRASE